MDTLTVAEVKEAEVKKAKAKGGQNFSEKVVVMYGKTYSLPGLPETQQSNCGVYGLALKLNRCIAGMNASTHTDAERSAQIDKTYGHLKENSWNAPGTGRGGGIKKAELEAKVKEQEAKLAEQSIKLEEALAMVAKLTVGK